MKRTVIAAIIASMLTGALGIWFGFQIQNPPITWDTTVTVTGRGGDYPKEAFRRVNFEIGGQIEALCAKSGQEHCFVAIVPETQGYRIQMAGERGSFIENETQRKELTDWIHSRMEQIQREEFQAQQVMGGNGDSAGG